MCFITLYGLVHNIHQRKDYQSYLVRCIHIFQARFSWEVIYLDNIKKFG